MRNHSLRHRLLYLLIIIVVILLGLGSRRYAEYFPPFVGVHFGDALWAEMIYFGFRFLRPQSGLRLAAAFSLLFCFAIELSQLYQAEWINDIRSTTLGGLILGRGFLVVDLVRYTVGIACAVLLDRLMPIHR